MRVEELLSALHAVKPTGPRQWMARCPAHEDHTPSLSVREGDGGRIVLNDFGHCDTAAIVAALGLTMRDLFNDDGRTPSRQVVRAAARHEAKAAASRARYELRDAEGTHSANHVRIDLGDGRKTFAYELPDGTSGLGGLPTAQLPLYGSELLREHRGESVIVVEGEKAAEALRARGFVAVGTACGASVTPCDDALLPLLEHNPVLLWPDNDNAGRAHMACIGERLLALGADVRLVTWADAPEKGDAADFTGSDEELANMIAASPAFSPSDVATIVATSLPELDRALRAGDAILDGPETPTPVWGRDDAVLWAVGESSQIVGGDGTGKSTLGQNLMLHGVGLRTGDLLGYPVQPFGGKCLYIAADRPAQVLRSLRRMVSAGDRDVLNERVVIWPGPLPFNLLTDPLAMRPFVEAHGCDWVIIDSIKDVILDVSSDQGGQAYNLARQDCLAHGIEWLELHHPRKVQAQKATGAQSAISAVHGSRWLVAGAGSVLLLEADPGDPLVRIRHLKQPASEVLGLEMLIDQDTGSVSVASQPNLLTWLRGRPNGCTVPEAAAYLLATSSPSKSQIEKARRALAQLCRKGLAHEAPGDAGGARGGDLTRYYATTERPDDGHGYGHAPLFDEAGTVRARTGTAAPESLDTAGTVRARTGTPPMGTNGPSTLVEARARARADEEMEEQPERWRP